MWFCGLTRKNWGFTPPGQLSKGKDGGLGLEAVWEEKRVSPLRSSQKRELLRSK